ncbi:MAG: hypothetical protein PVF51_02820 [Nitrospirota bacterium]|jgi:hypothetical protein
MKRLILAILLLLLGAPLGAADGSDHSRNSAHGPMCGADCRGGQGLGHSANSPVQYGSQPASSFGTGASDGMRPDRCRMPCRYTSSCCFHRVRTSEQPTPKHPHCRPRPPA